MDHSHRPSSVEIEQKTFPEEFVEYAEDKDTAGNQFAVTNVIIAGKHEESVSTTLYKRKFRQMERIHQLTCFGLMLFSSPVS
jgi:hypothetical protein